MTMHYIKRIFGGNPHKTAAADKKLRYPLDKVNRQLHVPAPNILRASDFTCVATWTRLAYVASAT